MAAFNLTSKCEQALVAYLLDQSALEDANIYPGKNSTDKASPCVICSAEQGPEDPPYTGNYMLQAVVEVRHAAPIDTDGEEPKEESDPLTAAVGDALHVTDLASQLSTQVDDFTCIAVVFDSVESSQDEDHWTERFLLTVYCCPSDF